MPSLQNVQVDSRALSLQLCGFLRNESNSVYDHQSAIETFRAVPYARILRHNLDSHETRVRLLARAIVRLGGNFETVFSAEDDMGGGSPVHDEPLGLVTTMESLVVCEERGRRMYELAMDTVDVGTRPFIQWLFSEQRDSCNTLLDLLSTMAVQPGHTHLARDVTTFSAVRVSS